MKTAVAGHCDWLGYVNFVNIKTSIKYVNFAYSFRARDVSSRLLFAVEQTKRRVTKVSSLLEVG